MKRSCCTAVCFAWECPSRVLALAQTCKRELSDPGYDTGKKKKGGGIEILTLLMVFMKIMIIHTKDVQKWKSEIPKPLLTWWCGENDDGNDDSYDHSDGDDVQDGGEKDDNDDADLAWSSLTNLMMMMMFMIVVIMRVRMVMLTWLDQAWHTWEVLVRSPWQLVAWKNATLITLCQIYIYCAKYFLRNILCQRYRDKYIEILVYCLIWCGQNSAAHCHELK